MSKRFNCSAGSSAIALLWALTAPTALAQTDPADGAEADDRDTIIVTAQKRAENVQDVPIAITALNAAALEAAKIEDSKDLQFNAPNVTLSANRNLTIRGVGSQSFGGTGDTNIGVLVNGVFLQSGSSFGDFFDMERIEVLRGPQGTIFGRNTTGGAVNFVTRRPTDAFEGYVDLQGESPRGVRASAALNIPLAPGLSQRFAANYINRDGYTKNLLDGANVDGRNQFTLRSSTRFEPTSSTLIDLTLTYFKEDSDRQNAAKSLCTPDPAFGCSPASASTGFPTSNFLIDSFLLPGVVRGGTFAPNPRNLREVAIDVRPFQKAEDFLATLEMSHKFGALTLTSVTGLRDGKNTSERDFDQGYRPNAFNPGTFGTLVVPNDGKGNGLLTYLLSGRPVTTTDYRTSQTGGGTARQFSQELRLSSQFDGPFNFIFGGFYLNARTSGYVDTWAPANLTRGAVSKFDTRLGQVKSYAVFGEAYFDITPTLKLTGGLRYTEDKKHIETASGTFVLGPYFIGDEKFDKVTGRAIVSWNPDLSFTADTNVYLSFSRGFKSGGFNPGNNTIPVFGSEAIDSYELGIKNTFLNGNGRLNLAAFNYDYSDLIVGNLVGTAVANVNIPKSRVRGLEAELVLTPTDPLRLEASLGLLDTSIRSDFRSSDPTRGSALFQIKGNQLPNAPRRTLKLAAEYTIEAGNDWTVRPRVDFYSQAGFYSREFNVPADRVGSWKQLDASVQVANGDKDWSLTAFVKNLTNEDSITFLEANSNLVGSFRSAFLLDPRTFGVSLHVGFR
ncbi:MULTISPECIES: TonB-dependent receptor [unclassified Sphingopyxis]|uniref:TonB-dependent receptor n=1 Tax=unclassified Sphingopyxis TaxID=2614943 RepID=UPI001F60CBBD|nr:MULTISPECIES: TonB-dependent receptor [unclassified Sphingopyxis]USI76575.1 TonB-dependent receptor [Sphingopyxis sp. USTB-05]